MGRINWVALTAARCCALSDALHNTYLQIAGRKRVILFPADSHDDLYVFPRLHPVSRPV